MTTPKRVLIIQNTPTGGPRRVGDWLSEAGLEVTVLKGFEAAVPTVIDHDGLIVLGGGYLPDADDRAHWLAPTRDLVEQAIEREVPMLGICLGGQMLAHVAGGVVEGDVGSPEYGSTPITFRSEVADDPVFHVVPDQVPGMEHHVDAITKLPPGAVWLAQSDRCPHQAFRVGRAAWGLQFHPEITPDSILTWDVDDVAAKGFDREELHRAAMADEPTSTPVWRTVTDRFAELINRTGG